MSTNPGLKHVGDAVGPPSSVGDELGVLEGAFEGDTVGDETVGALLGEVVGEATVGALLGEVVGDDTVGALLGEVVGEATVGALLGEATVGALLGEVVGDDTVGALLGEVVGEATVGAFEGIDEGRVVGDLVGAEESKQVIIGPVFHVYLFRHFPPTHSHRLRTSPTHLDLHFHPQ